MMDSYERDYSVDLFLYLSGVVKPKSNGWVSLRTSEVHLFSPSTDLFNSFKLNYFLVTSTNRDSKRWVGTYGKDGKLKGVKFPLFWCRDHYAKKLG